MKDVFKKNITPNKAHAKLFPNLFFQCQTKFTIISFSSTVVALRTTKPDGGKKKKKKCRR